jgi:hypothetical protein
MTSRVLRTFQFAVREHSTRILAGYIGNRIDRRFASTSRRTDKIQLGARY